MITAEIIAHIADAELKRELRRIIDIASAAERSGWVGTTRFLSPLTMRTAKQILWNHLESNMIDISLNPDPERKVLCFFPDYLDPSELEHGIRILQISTRAKGAKLGHRDYLGALLSLGIARDYIGDIVFDSDARAYVMVLEPMHEYIPDNLFQIRDQSVDIEIVNALPEIEKNYEELMLHVASNRLDSIVARICSVSRDRAQMMIQSGRVQVDYIETKQQALAIADGTVFSVRGHGKYRFVGVQSETKKGRLCVKVLKYLN